MSIPSDAPTAVAASARLEAEGVNVIVQDKAVKRFQVRNIVDASSQRDIRDASVYERSGFHSGSCVEYTLPKLYIKQQYCVSCAVHGRIVRGRKAEERRIREYVRPQFKGVSSFPSW